MIRTVLIEQETVPAPPSAGRVTVYAASDHHMYSEDATGVTQQLDGGSTSSAPNFSIGFNSFFFNLDTSSGGDLNAIPIRLISTVMPKSLSLYCYSPGSGLIVMGVYSNISTDPDPKAIQYPGSLLCTTATFSDARGWNESLIIGTVPTLLPGTYWLAFHVQLAGHDFLRTSTGDRWTLRKTATWTGVLPDPFPSPFASADGFTNVDLLFATVSPA